ncbi:amino acid ABC transporter permease [Thalassobacillus sp. CUG 92003]|uniref:amino acid ABC transporter permease n=1 Tax=Thalassobacillus sp. CUG 92003 TaxID=2736641 RepID=UPI0015E76FF6|nr:amino acid ABC transporter permease [Thalassobacillus sp. CUG 92003]
MFNVERAWDNLPFLLTGVPYTFLITIVGMALGLLLGFFLSLARSSKHRILRWPSRMYISFMRGTPVLVFLFILYMGLPYSGIYLQASLAAVLGFGLNSAAYIAEVNRAAMGSVPRGQWESAQAIGMNYWQTIRRIILPQAVRIAVPPLGNIFLDLLKATSLAAMISVPELFNQAQIVAGRTQDTMTMYILAALIYWPMTIVFSTLQDYLETKFSKHVS